MSVIRPLAFDSRREAKAPSAWPHAAVRPALLVNPWAGGGGRFLADSLRRFAGLGPVMVSTRASDLPRQLGELHAQGVNLLAVAGGDGTLQGVFHAVGPVWGDDPLRVLPVATGTVGLVHREMGAIDPEVSLAALEGLVAGRDTVEERLVPTLKVDGRTAFNFGVGMPEYFARKMRGQPNLVGFAAHAILSALVNGRFAREVLSPWEGELRIDHADQVEGGFSAIYASGLREFGPIRTWTQAQVGRDAMRLLVVDHVSPRRVLVGFPAFVGGLITGGVTVREARSIQLQAPAPFTYVADGEPYVADRSLNVEVSEPLRVLVPRLVGPSASASGAFSRST